MKWFRMYHTILDSLKVRKLPAEAQLDYFLLLCCASEFRERTNRNTGETGLNVADAVWRTRSATLAGTFPMLVEADLAGLDDDELIVMIGWEDKQFASDDVTARSSKSKEKSKGLRGGNVPGNALDTDTDTDTEADTDTENKGARKRTPASRVRLKTYLKTLKDSGEKFLPDDDPIFDYAKSIGLTTDMLRLSFLKFKDKYMDSAKLYVDWRATFRNNVKDRWQKLWYLDQASGQVCLTNDGLLAMQQFKDDAVLKRIA